MTAACPVAVRRPLRVAVLMGGTSREREVSLTSGHAVCEALCARGHTVTPLELDTDRLPALRPLGVEVAFIALHGRFGEDGGVQRACAAQGIAYTGSDARASARAFDKALARALFARAGLAIPPGTVLPQPLDLEAARAAMARFGPRVVLKPACEGSSIGVHLVEDERGLRRALEALAVIGQPVLVERFIPGREMTLAVLGDRVLAPVETITRRALFDYVAKYDPHADTRYVVDPPLERTAARRLAEAAWRAHTVLGCRSVSRVDLRLNPDGEAVVLEVNTIPGMTARSLLPKAAAACGIDFPTLCERLLLDAFAPRTPTAPAHAARLRHASRAAFAREEPRVP